MSLAKASKLLVPSVFEALERHRGNRDAALQYLLARDPKAAARFRADPKLKRFFEQLVGVPISRAVSPMGPTLQLIDVCRIELTRTSQDMEWGFRFACDQQQQQQQRHHDQPMHESVVVHAHLNTPSLLHGAALFQSLTSSNGEQFVVESTATNLGAGGVETRTFFSSAFLQESPPHHHHHQWFTSIETATQVVLKRILQDDHEILRDVRKYSSHPQVTLMSIRPCPYDNATSAVIHLRWQRAGGDLFHQRRVLEDVFNERAPGQLQLSLDCYPALRQVFAAFGEQQPLTHLDVMECQAEADLFPRSIPSIDALLKGGFSPGVTAALAVTVPREHFLS